jgi:predicted amidohydrolase
MKDFLNISLVQSNPVWEDAPENMRRVENIIKNIPFAQDMVIFPEMFLTGFSMNVPKISEPMDGKMVHWMKDLSKNLNANIIGSLPIVENNRYYNRLIIVTTENQLIWYDKRHLFRMGEELQHYTGGNAKIIFEYQGWGLLPLVCYDLRFPVWSRNRNLAYSVLLYVANWPAPRNDAFLTLLKARAIENSCYVIGVNRVGTDGANLRYMGNSVVYDAKGNVVAGLLESEETVVNVQLSLKDLNSYRKKFPVHLDGDDFEIK